MPGPSAVVQASPEGPRSCASALALPTVLRLPWAGCHADAADAAADVLRATRRHIWLHGGSCAMGSTAEWPRVCSLSAGLRVSPWLANALQVVAGFETPALRKVPLLAGCVLKKRDQRRAVHMTKTCSRRAVAVPTPSSRRAVHIATPMGHCALMLKIMRAKAPSPTPTPTSTPQCHLADSGLSDSPTDAGRAACAGGLPAVRSPAAGGWRLGEYHRAMAQVMCT